MIQMSYDIDMVVGTWDLGELENIVEFEASPLKPW